MTFLIYILSTPQYYPTGQATCCRAALLFANGTSAQLSHCPASCSPSPGTSGISCGSDDVDSLAATGKLIANFGGTLRQPGEALGLANAIPIGPVGCCAVCTGDLRPAGTCEAFKFCSAHGSCGLSGRCMCDAGWGGDECDVSSRDGSVSAPVVAGVIAFLAVLLLGALGRAFSLASALDNTRRAAAAAAAQRRADLDVHLLPESDDDDAEWGEEQGEEEGEVEGEGYLPPDAEAATAPHEAVDEPHAVELEAVATEAAEPEHDATAALDGEKARPNYLRTAPVCTICMDAKVQSVLVPCGHACACRTCARRLRRCPVCRVLITKRQKLFIVE